MATNQELAIQKYRRQARTYDRRTARGESIRRRAIARLDLQPGHVVLEVACGTGINFAAIENAIGKEGHLIGIDFSPDMLAQARQRIADYHWRNTTLIESAAEKADVSRQVDAVLFSFTHDVLQSRDALERVLRSVKPGGRIVAASAKWAAWWAVPVNLAVWYHARRWVTTFEGFRQPWQHLGRLVVDLEVESVLFGSAFVAWGNARGASP